MATTFKREFGQPHHSYRCNECGKRMVFSILSNTYHALKHWVGRQHVFLEIMFDSASVQTLRRAKLERAIEAYNHAFDQEIEYKIKEDFEKNLEPKKDFKIYLQNGDVIRVKNAVKFPASIFSTDKKQDSYIFRSDDKVVQVFMDKVACIEATQGNGGGGE